MSRTGMSEGSSSLRRKRNIGLAAIALLVAILAYAWIDGGEEPLHPIAQPVPVPESAG